MGNLILINFKLSVLVTIVGCLLLFTYQATNFPDSLAHLGPYQNQTLIWPAIIIVATLFGWFNSYKNDEGQLGAFIIGFFILVPVFSSSVSEAINEVSYNNNEQLFLAYVGFSHILYGWLDWREVLKGLGKDGH